MKQPKLKPKNMTTNDLTNAIRGELQFHGFPSWRINVQGQYDNELGIWRKSGSTKGVFDIHTIIFGRSVWIDFKTGNDKPSDEQLLFQQQVEQAGGIAIFVKDLISFREWFLDYLRKEGKDE